MLGSLLGWNSNNYMSELRHKSLERICVGSTNYFAHKGSLYKCIKFKSPKKLKKRFKKIHKPNPSLII